MLWTEADLKASGVPHDPMMTEEDSAYIVAAYRERYQLHQEMRSFQLATRIDVEEARHG